MSQRFSATAIRFAAVGLVNTAIDLLIFMSLHDKLGVTVANFVSSSAGMTFSFVVNGLFTFQSQNLTLRHALLFVASTGTVLWVAQPLLIHGWLWLLEQTPQMALLGMNAESLHLWVAKLASIACCLALNFVAYRYVVWPLERVQGTSEDSPDA